MSEGTVVVNPRYSIIGDFEYDSLIAGEQQPIIPKGVLLAPGQGVLARGTLLGIQTANGFAYVCDSTAGDGTQNPMYILGLQQGQLMDPTQTTIDTGVTNTGIPIPAMAYQTGVFNRYAIICKAGQVISTFEQGLHARGIILKGTIPNPTTAADALALNVATAALSGGSPTVQLTYAFTPSSTTNQNVTWMSSNTAAATVNANGLVTRVATGTATITATSMDDTKITAQCTVTCA
jgi:hypothetical protein